MKFSVKNKIFLLYSIVIIISISIVGYFGFYSAKEAYKKSALTINKSITKALANEIKGFLQTIPDDVVYNSNFYALQNFFIWKDLNEKRKERYWKDVYISSLRDYMLSKKIYYQARVLDHFGKEVILLKFDEIDGKVIKVSENNLQDKSRREYYKKAINLKKGEFYISPMNLNIEHGVIERPFVPVVRYATPIVNANGEKKGVLILNFNAKNILKTIEKTKLEDENSAREYYLVNKDGFYLYNQNSDKMWAFQLGNDYNFKRDFPGVFEKIKNIDEQVFISNGKIFSVQKIYPDKVRNPYRYWYLITALDETEAFKSLNNFKILFLIILFVILVLGFILVSSFITKLTTPLSKVTNILNSLAKGEIKKEDINYDSDDEIKEIVVSTQILTEAIETTIKQAKLVADGNFSQDIKLLGKNDELGLAILNMTKRLKEISSLARNLSIGNYDVKIIVKNNDDQLGVALSQMIEYLENITMVAESISVGNINIKYSTKGKQDRLGNAILQMIMYLKNVFEHANAISKGDFSKNLIAKGKTDELGLALSKMTELLRINDIKNKEEIWFSEGISSFSNSLTNKDDIIELSKVAVSNICKYIEAVSGLVYINREDTLDLIATYSYTNRRNLSNQYKFGQGLIGQVALEKESILIKNVSSEEFDIDLGVIQTKPAEVYALPVIFEKELLAVVEFMSFNSFDKLKKRYLNKVIEVFAIAFNTTIQNQKIKELLEESNIAYKELQEKSLEIQKTNQRIEKQSHELEIQAEELKKKNAQIEKASVELDKRAKELELSNKYKSEFLANMSHELRTPLNSIILLSSLLAKNNNKLSDDDIKKALVIHNSGQELLRLINDILDLSKIEAGKMDIIIDKINSKEFLDYFYQIYIHEAEKKGIEFEAIDNFKGFFYSDKQRLGQILRNLLSNAFKFTEKGKISLLINKYKEFIKIIVSDTGIGIPKDKQDLIFQAFSQADGSTSRKYGGTGLGLSITKELVTLLGGEIKLESKENKGSTFIITLPNLENKFKNDIEFENKKVDMVIDKDIDIDTSCLKGKSITIIDKNIKTIFILDSKLSSFGMKVNYYKNIDNLDIKADILLVNNSFLDDDKLYNQLKSIAPIISIGESFIDYIKEPININLLLEKIKNNLGDCYENINS